MIRQINLIESDIRGLVDLVNQWDDVTIKVRYKSTYKKVESIQKNHIKSVIFIYEQDKKIIGYIYLSEVIFLGLGTFIEIQSLLVDKKHRRKGIGKDLMLFAEKWAVTNDYKKIILSSRIILSDAHKFYKSLGYDIVKESYLFSKSL